MEFVTQSGKKVGRVGQGTWHLGEKRSLHAREIDALRAGVAAGMSLIDTAEMYGDGAAESLVGEAIRGLERDDLFLVSKVYPWNAGRSHIFDCCADSLERMGTDYVDLYLLHWQGSVPFAETIECMEELKDKGMIRSWGVSNLDTREMEALLAEDGGTNCATDQVLYHLGSRGIEFDLLPWLRERDIPVMAYCPLAQAGALRRGLLSDRTVLSVAEAHSATPQQIMLAFILSREGVYPIPRSSDPAHAEQNAAAAAISLTSGELASLDAAFPAPDYKTPLDVE